MTDKILFTIPDFIRESCGAFTTQKCTRKTYFEPLSILNVSIAFIWIHYSKGSYEDKHILARLMNAESVSHRRSIQRGPLVLLFTTQYDIKHLHIAYKNASLTYRATLITVLYVGWCPQLLPYEHGRHSLRPCSSRCHCSSPVGYFRADSRFSQWETALFCNEVSHLASRKPRVIPVYRCTVTACSLTVRALTIATCGAFLPILTEYLFDVFCYVVDEKLA